MLSKRQGGVYGIRCHTEEKRLSLTDCLLKIGHSSNFKKRFYNYIHNSLSLENIEIDVRFILHSENQAFSGTKLMESIIHNLYSFYRVKKSREIFKFGLDFTQTDEWFNDIKNEFELNNITDLTLHHSLETVPSTIFPDSYENEQKSFTDKFIPKLNQEPIIEKTCEHFKNFDKGGLYLACGYGKTYISIFSMIKMKVKKVLILTHRLTIIREWEKVLNLAKLDYIVADSENKYNLQKCRKTKKLFIITTYQTYCQKHEEFEDEYDFVIHDEAHILESGGEFSKCLNLKGKKLSLTATPSIHFFENDYESMKTIELSESKYGKAIESISIHDAIDQGCLCDYRLVLHNKPSGTECFEHINELNLRYGRKKILIFYNLREDAKKAQANLTENGISNVWYVDGLTSKKRKGKDFYSI